MRLRCAALFTLLCLLMPLAFAQEITGDIRGTVRDSSGAVVRGAKVQVINTDRNQVVRTLTTGADGAYNVTILPVGHYKVTVDAQGFAPCVANDIVLNLNDRRVY